MQGVSVLPSLSVHSVVALVRLRGVPDDVLAKRVHDLSGYKAPQSVKVVVLDRLQPLRPVHLVDEKVNVALVSVQGLPTAVRVRRVGAVGHVHPFSELAARGVHETLLQNSVHPVFVRAVEQHQIATFRVPRTFNYAVFVAPVYLKLRMMQLIKLQ